MTSTSKQKKKQFGFTLIEISLVITLIGFAVAASTISFVHFSNEMKIRTTQERIDTILNALSIYAQKNYRVPCGADPAAAGATMGTEPNNGRCFNRNATMDNGYEALGIVPWKTLGLTEQDVTDGWGRYFTYKPAPHLTLDMTSNDMMTAANANPDTVHDACRGMSWYDEGGRHINRAKALFCCNAPPMPEYLAVAGAASATDISGWNEVVSVPTQNTGTLSDIQFAGWITAPVTYSNRWIENNSNATASRIPLRSFSKVYTTAEGGISPLSRATGIAVSLISHGSNGKFSFKKRAAKSDRRMGVFNPLTGALTTNQMGASDIEIANALQATAGMIENIKSAINMTGGGALIDLTGQKDNASDDITISVRSDQLISRLGNTSCEKLSNIMPVLSPPIDGVCNPVSHLQTLFVAPSAPNLCTTGTASAVTGTGSWLWNCTGSNGGDDQNCIAFD